MAFWNEIKINLEHLQNPVKSLFGSYKSSEVIALHQTGEEKRGEKGEKVPSPSTILYTIISQNRRGRNEYFITLN